MTMDFQVAPQVDLGASKPGGAAACTRGAAGPDGGGRIEGIQPR